MDATDFEHDSAYALSLPLIGLEFQGVHYHQTQIRAWVGVNPEHFHVPLPGYDPTKHPKAVVCTNCPKKHPIVPEGFYFPPFERELFKKIRGREVLIKVGPAPSEECSFCSGEGEFRVPSSITKEGREGQKVPCEKCYGSGVVYI
jgi:hypothetical protein